MISASVPASGVPPAGALAPSSLSETQTLSSPVVVKQTRTGTRKRKVRSSCDRPDRVVHFGKTVDVFGALGGEAAVEHPKLFELFHGSLKETMLRGVPRWRPGS